jgi:hypothetical protein
MEFHFYLNFTWNWSKCPLVIYLRRHDFIHAGHLEPADAPGVFGSQSMMANWLENLPDEISLEILSHLADEVEALRSLSLASRELTVYFRRATIQQSHFAYWE